jgi:photosystem II stability/assembly factor-like uncharacterized protein
MKKLALFFGCTLVLLSADTFGPKWTSVSNGLTGSVPSITALVVDASTGSTLYATTSSGGVFRSSDGGATWRALGGLAWVNVVALDPSSASTVYAGASTGIFKSTDGGDHWASLGLADTPITVVAVDPFTPSTVYAGGNGALYKSKDGGANWTNLNIGPSPFGLGPGFTRDLLVDPFTPSTLYVAADNGLATNFLKSQDGGQSWNAFYPNAFGGPFSIGLVMDPSNPSTLYAVNPLQKSTDGGVSWTRLSGPISGVSGAGALAVDPQSSNTLYVATVEITAPCISPPCISVYGIFKSTDGGRSWNALNTTVPAVQSLVFSPSNAIFAGTSGGVFKSTDGGVSWGQTNDGLSVLDIEVLAGDPVSPATIYAGGNNGLFKSLDGGGSWSALDAPSPLRSLLIDLTNPNVLYLQPIGALPCAPAAGALDLYKSTNGGTGWSNIWSHSPASGCQAESPAMTMDPIDPNTLYLPYGDAYYGGFTILKSADGGADWTSLVGAGLDNANGIFAFAIDPRAPTDMYVAADVGVFRSTNGGVNFAPAGLANTVVSLLVIDPVHPGVLYAATWAYGFPGLYKSVDSGASWSPINQGLDQIVAAHASVNALAVDPARTEVLYLATSGYGVFRSTDSGANWAAFNDGLTFLDVRSLALSQRDPGAPRGRRSGVLGSNTLYAGTPGGVFKIQ